VSHLNRRFRAVALQINLLGTQFNFVMRWMVHGCPPFDRFRSRLFRVFLHVLLLWTPNGRYRFYIRGEKSVTD
jgi:hypothetical protein